ncbi:MAG TPA: hypothetical protein VIG48_12370 [Jatrophihabitans sp.]
MAAAALVADTAETAEIAAAPATTVTPAASAARARRVELRRRPVRADAGGFGRVSEDMTVMRLFVLTSIWMAERHHSAH